MGLSDYIDFLCRHFGLDAENASIKPIGSGHINTTLLLDCPEKILVVQKLNTQVFPQVNQLVNNARLIEKHLLKKKASGDYALEVIQHVPTQDKQFVIGQDSNHWRALEFIGGSYSEDVVKNPSQAKIAAGAFGQFAAALQDFDASRLYEVIPDFHHLAKRMSALQAVIDRDPAGRVAECDAEIAFCMEQQPLVEELSELMASLPLRPCHNDTKINNMLFCSDTHQAKAVIDLDTCMPGFWLYDFGDMVRTFCSPEPEDSINLDQVVIREDIFKAIVDGYVAPLREYITKDEIESFWVGAKVMCLMIGVRFLTDHLDGDNYFGIKRAGHNLDRARNQFRLYRDLLEKEALLKPLLSDC